MTEGSKARKRHPMQVITAPPMDPEQRAQVMRYLGTIQGSSHMVMPHGSRFEVVTPKMRRPLSVVFSGISCRAGVGGRRHRARRRAEARFRVVAPLE